MCTCLRIDNSRCGAVYVLWNISRTKIATMSYDSSNERAHFAACVDTSYFETQFSIKIWRMSM